MTRPSFITRRLALIPATGDDVDAVWQVWRHPEVRRYLFDDVPVTRERAAEALTAPLTSGDEKIGLWTVRPRGPDQPIVGTVGLLRTTVAAPHDPEFRGMVEVLAAFAPEVWGRGYATEALAGIVAHAFGALGLVRLVAVADLPNEASHRMLRGLGFTETGECAGPRGRLRTYVLTPPRQATTPRA